MNRYDLNIFLFFIIILMVILTTKDYQFKQLKNYFLFEMSKTEKVYGFISSLETYDDTNGGRSFRYIVKYSFQNKTYELHEESSPFQISGVYQNDSILVKLIPDRPQIASIKDKRIRVIDLMLAGLVTIAEIIIVANFIKYLIKWIKMRFHFRSDSNK